MSFDQITKINFGKTQAFGGLIDHFPYYVDYGPVQGEVGALGKQISTAPGTFHQS